jgi:hypothetical protein
MQYACDRAVGLILALVEPALAVEVAEELVSSVDEVDDHGRSRWGHGGWPACRHHREAVMVLRLAIAASFAILGVPASVGAQADTL